VYAAVELAIARAQEVADMYEQAAAALDQDISGLLEQLAPPTTPLPVYASHISKFQGATQSVATATPSEARRVARDTTMHLMSSPARQLVMGCVLGPLHLET
jgi:hypothetical protein